MPSEILRFALRLCEPSTTDRVAAFCQAPRLLADLLVAHVAIGLDESATGSSSLDILFYRTIVELESFAYAILRRREET